MKQQVRGFGFLHDGSVDMMFRFVSASVFAQRDPSPILGTDPRTPPNLLDDNGKDPGNRGGLPLTPAGIHLRRDLEAFLLAFDSNLAPIVGQQATLTATNAAVVMPRIDLLINLAEAKKCDLVARTRKTGYLYRDGRFVPASVGRRLLLDAELRTKATKRYGEVTYTCAPPGSGQRIARGRDDDKPCRFLTSYNLINCSGSQSKTLGTAIKPIFGHRSVLRLRSPWGAWVFLPYMYGDGIPGSNIPGCRY